MPDHDYLLKGEVEVHFHLKLMEMGVSDWAYKWVSDIPVCVFETGAKEGY